VQAVSSALKIISLILLKENIQIIKYKENFKTKFDYSEFTFLYVPKTHLKYGGILKKGENIKYRKVVQSRGLHLIYPSKTAYTKIKEKVCKVINKLSKNSIIEVINECNLIISHWVHYFAWNNAYSRLNSLDHFIYKRFKRRLIKKFRSRGRLRIKWVVDTFMMCNTDKIKNVSIKSPYNRKWHIHVKLPHTKDNKKRIKDTLFLQLATKGWKNIVIDKCILPYKVRTTPYYLVKESYAKVQAALTLYRSSFPLLQKKTSH